jgi:TPP-dependent trihydroxycyclohexane-1,2-dione (THcHDO) dehydratase
LLARGHRTAERLVIISGGGVHYSLAETRTQRRLPPPLGIPVVETVAGSRRYCQTIPPTVVQSGRLALEATNDMAHRDADLIIAVRDPPRGLP